MKRIYKNSIKSFIMMVFVVIISTSTIYAESYEVGDTVKFGKYEQDNDTANGKEDIEWKVIDKNGDYHLLLSTRVLDCMQFNTTPGHITYASSSLRRFLNGTFYNNSFSASEKSKIFKIKNKNDANVKFNIDAGADTDDYAFVLSLEEYKRYFGDMDDLYENRDAVAYGTMYAYTKGLEVNAHEDMWCQGYSPYWLRTPGSYRTAAIYVSSNGGYILWGDLVDYTYGVRPAMWVEFK